MNLMKMVVYRYLIILAIPLLVISSCNRDDTRYKGEGQSVGSMDSSSADSTLYKTTVNHPIKMAMHNMVEDMKDMQPTGSVDNDFAQIMLKHHEGGVNMADAELSSGKDAEMKKMAQKIKDTQLKESTELRKFVEAQNQQQKNQTEQNKTGQPSQHTITNMQGANPNPGEERTPFTEMLSYNDQLVAKAEEVNISTDYDDDFAKFMIMHHQSAIDIANVEVTKGKDSKMKEMAKKMIKENKKGIDELNNILNK